ncbi:hypothetical protein HMN09_00986600 [Mycena chlorophos]|uniref:Uncharacterized protein n=1 Tax=Mycena chlorophos TaxID=658473 RepID=A0A8H6SHP4_MYCCL|nr:hypothetical protein HMN09_00986600 [Mycena chlorophos]
MNSNPSSSTRASRTSYRRTEATNYSISALNPSPNLAFFRTSVETSSGTALPRLPKLWCLSCSVPTLHGITSLQESVIQSKFPRLTHVEVGGYITGDFLASVRTLPTLTHLACTNPGENVLNDQAQPIRTFFEDTPRLQALIIVCGRGSVREYLRDLDAVVLAVGEIRLTGGTYPDGRGDDYWREWQDSALGTGMDYWGRCDIFLERKRKGEVEASRRWMDDWVYDTGGDTPGA